MGAYTVCPNCGAVNAPCYPRSQWCNPCVLEVLSEQEVEAASQLIEQMAVDEGITA